MRAKKVDANHAEIRDHLRAIGWSVSDTAPLGGGFPDLVCARGGHTGVVEIKHGKAEPNDLQKRFRNGWRGAYFIVRSPADAEEQLAQWLRSLKPRK